MLFICLESTIIWILLELVSLGSDTCDSYSLNISESFISECQNFPKFFKIFFEIGDFSFQLGFQNAVFDYDFIFYLDQFHFGWLIVTLSRYEYASYLPNAIFSTI